MKNVALIITILFSIGIQAQEIRYLVPPSGSTGTDLRLTPEFTGTKVNCNLEHNVKVNYLGKSNTVAPYAKVEVLEGDCLGNTGWVSWAHVSMRHCGQ